MSRWLVRAAVSAAAAAILLAVVPLDTVIDAIGRITLGTWTASLGVFFGGHYLNALKLRCLLGQPSVRVWTCVQAQYAGLVANLGLPGLAGGDLVRAAYLVPAAGARRVAIASVADRILDTLTLLALVGIALPIAGVPPAIVGMVPRAGWWIAAAAAGGALVVAVAVLLRTQPALSIRLIQAWRDITARRSAIASAVAISLVVQPAFVLTNAWLAREVGVATGLAAWFVAWPLSKLVAVLPISLGGIGVREAALVSLMAPYGAPRDAVLASGILWQTVLAASGLAGLIVTQWWRRPATTPAPVTPPQGGA